MSPIDLSGVCPRASSPLDLARADLARVTAAYFAGAPVYDQMRALEDKLFAMMWPKATRAKFTPPANWI
jgi:hypothetical protein